MIEEERRARRYDHWQPRAPLELVFAPEPDEQNMFGSYLVLRKLEQNFRAFNTLDRILRGPARRQLWAAACSSCHASPHSSSPPSSRTGRIVKPSRSPKPALKGSRAGRGPDKSQPAALVCGRSCRAGRHTAAPADGIREHAGRRVPHCAQSRPLPTLRRGCMNTQRSHRTLRYPVAGQCEGPRRPAPAKRCSEGFVVLLSCARERRP